MKSHLSLLALISFLLLIISCQPEVKVNIQTTDPSSETSYDSTLAQKLGADDYGMRHYVMAFLKAGPERDQDSTSPIRTTDPGAASLVRISSHDGNQ